MGSSTVAFFGRIYMMIKNKGDEKIVEVGERPHTEKQKCF